MMIRKRPIVSIFTTIWGHKSIGIAVKDAIEKRYTTYYNFIEPNSISSKQYNLLYVLFPSLTKIPFKMAEYKYVSAIIEKYLSKPYIKSVENYIKKQKPEIVISTYFAFSFVLEKFAAKYNFTLINIVADPKSFHKLETSPNAINFVFDEGAVKRCIGFGVPEKNIIQSGWFVRKEFQKTYRMEKVRKSLGLPNGELIISVIGGSEGTTGILKILPAFLDLKEKLQVIFICGNNKSLFQSLKLFQKIHKLQNRSNIKFIVKSFTENTHEYIQASNIVIGKAGPNLLFETVANLTPFFAVSHIAGQEDGNLDIIRKYKLGFVEENPIKAIKLVKKIISNPKMLDRFQKPLQNLAEYNNKSSGILISFINKKISKKKVPKSLKNHKNKN